MQTSPIVLRGAALITAGAAIAWLIVRQFIAVYHGLYGALDIDEIEDLHSASYLYGLIASGRARRRIAGYVWDLHPEPLR